MSDIIKPETNNALKQKSIAELSKIYAEKYGEIPKFSSYNMNYSYSNSKSTYIPAMPCKMTEEAKDRLKKYMLANGIVLMPSFHINVEMGARTPDGYDELEENFLCLGEMLLSKDSENIINKIMADMIKDAFRNRYDMYLRLCLSGDPVEIAKFLKLRIEADRHLVFLIKTFQEMNKPPLKVSIKSAEAVNIGDTVDKQLNITVADKGKGG